MGETAAPVKRPRFPWPAALLCAACVGAAAWTWDSFTTETTEITEDGPRGRGDRRVVALLTALCVLCAVCGSRRSISGLAVGAMGAFVFALCLRRWVKGRRAWRDLSWEGEPPGEPDAAAPHGAARQAPRPPDRGEQRE